MRISYRILTAFSAAFLFSGAAINVYTPENRAKADVPHSEVYITSSVANITEAKEDTNIEVISAASFRDISEDSWYYKYIDPLAKNGIFLGTSPTTFDPELYLSASQLLTLITRYLGVEDEVLQYVSDGTVKGSERWYYPYVSVLYSGGFLEEGEFGIQTNREGSLIIDDSCAEILESPITREKTAELLARSFELDGMGLESKVNYREISAYGHEFIRGGIYDNEAVEKYASLIKDIDDVSSEYLEDVLKCYYNGIFAGDDKGNFSPKAYLKRSEGAKIVAAALYRDLRDTRDLRERDIEIDDSGVYIGNDGRAHLTEDTVKTIFEKTMDNISVVNESGKNYLSLSPQSICPDGYYCEILVSRYLYGANYRAYYFNQSILGSAEASSSEGIRISLLYGGAPCEATVTLILRNMVSSEVEALSEYRVSKSLEIKNVSFEHKCV